MNNAFEVDAGGPSPIREATEKMSLDEHAQNCAARVLGHNRVQVTSCYLDSNTAIAARAPTPIDASKDTPG